MGQIDQDTSSDALSVQLLGLYFAHHFLLESLDLPHERLFEILVGNLSKVLKLLLFNDWTVEGDAVSIREEAFEKPASSIFHFSFFRHPCLLLQGQLQVLLRCYCCTFLVNKGEIEVPNEPEEGGENLGELFRVLLVSELGTPQLDMLSHVDNQVELRQALLIYRVHAVVNQLAAKKQTESQNAQVVVLTLVDSVESFAVDHYCSHLLASGRPAVRDWACVNPKTLQAR
jgi:hypothetical protein